MMRKRKIWTAVTCILSFALVGNLSGNVAFAIRENWNSRFSEDSSYVENYSIVESDESTTEREKFVDANGKVVENEDVICYLSTHPIAENLKKIWEGNVAFCQNNGENSDDIPIYDWVNDADSFFLLDDTFEIQDGENIYVSVNDENVAFFKEEDVLNFNAVQNQQDVLTDGLSTVSLILSEDGTGIKIDTSASSEFKLTIDEFNLFKNNIENYGIGKNENGTISFVKKIYSANKTMHGQYIIDISNSSFCGGKDIYALQKEIFGTKKEANYNVMYEFALQSSENDDFGLVQRDDDFFLVYRGEKTEKSSNEDSVTSTNAEKQSSIETEVIEEQSSDAVSDQAISEENQEIDEEQEVVPDESESEDERMYKVISLILLGAFILIGGLWISWPWLEKIKNK